MATGLDEDYKKPKNITDQLVRLLDDDSVSPQDRLRLILQYILYRDGIFDSDTQKLLHHAQLPLQDVELIHNFGLLGARILRPLKDPSPPRPSLFARKQAPPPSTEDMTLSRFEPAVKLMLEDLSRGVLEQSLFPYTKPLIDGDEALSGQAMLSQSSLRSAKPTWARTRPFGNESRQRIIVFMAGGATFSESRSCYEVSRSYSKDVYLATSHMLTPGLFIGQVGDLNMDPRRLDLPADRPKPRAPAYLFEDDAPSQSRPQPPVAAMDAMKLKSDGQKGSSASNGPVKPEGPRSYPIPSPTYSSSTPQPAKETKDKKRGFFKF
jgi:syntaxin-binding protein 1